MGAPAQVLQPLNGMPLLPYLVALKGTRGSSLPSVVLSVLIGVMSLYCFSTLTKTSVTQQSEVRRKLLAESFASELVEAFRSQKGIPLLTVLGANPRTFCESISDPRASLPKSALDQDTSVPASRIYLVQVADVSVSPPVIKPEYCGTQLNSYVGGNDKERLLMTVEVNWNDRRMKTTEPKKVTLSTFVPEW